ncbi:unnamed protein product [Lampetra planeri]
MTPCEEQVLPGANGDQHQVPGSQCSSPPARLSTSVSAQTNMCKNRCAAQKHSVDQRTKLAHTTEAHQENISRYFQRVPYVYVRRGLLFSFSTLCRREKRRHCRGKEVTNWYFLFSLFSACRDCASGSNADQD